MTLDSIPKEQMLRGAIYALPRSEKKGVPLWSVVASICCVGSTTASLICVELGWKPDNNANIVLPSCIKTIK